MSRLAPTLTKTGLPPAPGDPTAPPQDRSPQGRKSPAGQGTMYKTSHIPERRGRTGRRWHKFIWGWCVVRIHKASAAKQKA